MTPMIYTLYGFAIFFFIFWCGKWLVHLLAISYGKYKLHKKVCNIPRETPLPGVSILKPLMGTDPNLSLNLETFFTMNYPTYELLFCIEDKDDPAIEVVQKLLDKHPQIDAQLFIGGSDVGVNPKINNMNPGYKAAKYDLMMISDSGIRMKEDTLLDMVQHMTDTIGLVHQMPFTCDRDGFAATFEKIFFGTVQSRIYLSADFLGINCHTGMSCLLRKNVINKLGGLRRFGCYLAEDFFIAKAMTDNGWKTRISSQPAWQNSGVCDISNFQARLTRWAKLRVAMVPTTILLEPLSECMVVGAFASWAVSLLFNWDSLVFYLIHILMWFLSDWILLSIVQNGSLPFNKFDFVVGWLFREISGPYLFLHALWDPAIRWRTRVYKLAWGGIAYELSSTSSSSFGQQPPSSAETISLKSLKPNVTAGAPALLSAKDVGPTTTVIHPSLARLLSPNLQSAASITVPTFNTSGLIATNLACGGNIETSIVDMSILGGGHHHSQTSVLGGSCVVGDGDSIGGTGCHHHTTLMSKMMPITAHNTKLNSACNTYAIPIGNNSCNNSGKDDTQHSIGSQQQQQSSTGGSLLAPKTFIISNKEKT